MGRALAWFALLVPLVFALWWSERAFDANRAAHEATVWESFDSQTSRAAQTLEEELRARSDAAEQAAATVLRELEANPSARAADVLDAALRDASRSSGEQVGAWLVPDWRGRYGRRPSPAPEDGVAVQDDDYTRATHDPWHRALVEGRGWLTYTDPTDHAIYAQYAVPLTAPLDGGGERTVGVVFTRYPRAEIEALLGELGLSRAGYAFLITDGGSLIGHPLVDASAGLYTAAMLAERLHDNTLREVGRIAPRGETGVMHDSSDGEADKRATRRWRYTPIPSTGWSLVTVIPESEALQPGTTQLQHTLHVRLGWLLAALVVLVAVSSLTLREDVHRWRAYVVGLSLLFGGGIWALWQVGMEGDDLGDGQAFLLDSAGVERYLAVQEGRLYGEDAADRELTRVPAGVHIQSLEFQSANNIAVTGVAWIRLDSALPDPTNQGIYFPEAVDQQIDELYRRDIVEHGEVVGRTIGYRFQLVVRETFNFDRYPFDKKDVWLLMLPESFDADVVLVPDLDAYPVMNPLEFPGVENGIVLAGWSKIRSYFRYRENSYSADFGMRDYVGRTGFPELYFTVDLRRDFVNALVSDIIPLLVACLLFGVLLTSSPNAQRVEKLGFNFTNTLAACSGLVFVVLLAHIQLRSTLPGQQVTYLEWYYFAMYIAVIGVAINAWQLVRPKPPWFVEYHDNELAHLAFWPLLMLAQFLTTWSYFYPWSPVDASSNAIHAASSR
jgi:hypothetical protein